MMQASSTGYLARLFRLLTAHFNLDELRTLCFDLSVDYDALRGEEKATKALELISLMLREHRLDELVSSLRKGRPSADWPTEAEQPSPDELLAWATPGTLNAADYLALSHVAAVGSSMPAPRKVVQDRKWDQIRALSHQFLASTRA